jgi:hypothetical protein
VPFRALFFANFAELTSLLKNSSVSPSEIPSRAQRPAFAAVRKRFGSVRILFWSIDRSDNDFFNRL